MEPKQGGYRLQQISSEKITGKPVLSIITVVYNSEELLPRTLQSIQNQTYPNIEHVIIDGGSSDRTLDIIKKQTEKIAFWKSEKDKGIYDAMNKGLQEAQGDYVLFLNSGDEFYSNTTVEKIFENPAADVYYGDTEIVDNEGKSLGKRRLPLPEKLTWKSLRVGMVVCHQSLIIKRELTQPYNIQYRISADIDWVINCLKKAKEIRNCKMFISRFLEGGMSNKHMKQGLKERFYILNTHFGIVPNIIAHGFITFRLLIHLLKRK